MSDKSGDTQRRHIFISHHHKDDGEVANLTDLMSRHGYDIRNSSIRAKPANQRRLEQGLVKDETIRRLLRMKISWSGCVVVLIGKETHSRPWVNWEIDEAHRQGKRIVGVWAHGAKESDIPPSLTKYGDPVIVGWQSDRIIDAIDGKISDWQKPDGAEWPERQIPRIRCQ
jgi:hypothetical protein